LFVTWPGGGNVHPLVALAAKLRARGHDVHVLASPELRDRFESEGIDFVAHRSMALRELADDVLAELTRRPTDIAVVDYMQPQALSACEAAGVPTVAYVHTLYTRVAVSDSSPMAMAGTLDAINVLREDLGLAPVDALPAVLGRCSRVFVVTVEDLDRPEAVPANVRFVGPVVEGAGPDEGWRPPWPEGNEPLVHVSAGTVPPDDLVLPIVQKVLDATTSLPVHTLATVAGRADRPWKSATDPDLGLLRVPENATVLPYVRHAALLPHVDLFVTHAGLSSIGAALTYGVPMVCIPIFNEQPANAAHVAELGAGRTLDSEAGVEELRDAISDVLGDPRYRTTAAAVSQRIKQLGNGEAAVRELEQMLS